MNIGDFSGIVILGVGASVLVQFIKSVFGTESNKTKAVLVVLSILLGTAYYFIQLNENLFQTIVTIVGIASTVYSFIIKK